MVEDSESADQIEAAVSERQLFCIHNASLHAFRQLMLPGQLLVSLHCDDRKLDTGYFCALRHQQGRMAVRAASVLKNGLLFSMVRQILPVETLAGTRRCIEAICTPATIAENPVMKDSFPLVSRCKFHFHPLLWVVPLHTTYCLHLPQRYALYSPSMRRRSAGY